MATKHRILAVGLAGLALFGSGCASTVTITQPDGSSVEMPQDVYMAQQQNEQAMALAEKFAPAFAPANSELSETGEVADSMRKVMMMTMLPQLAESLQSDGYWRHKAAKLQFWGNIIAGPATALLQPFAHRLAYGKRGGYAAGGGSYTEVHFGNRKAKGGGSGPEGVSSVSASGDSDYEDIYLSTGNRSPLNIGDGRYLTGKDSQYQQGDGTQAQAMTDPPSIQQPESSVNVDSRTGIDFPQLP